MNTGERIAWLSLHVLLFMVPLAISNTIPWSSLPLAFDQFDIAKLFVMRACTIVGAAGWVIHMLLRGGKVRLSKIDWLVLVFLAWVAITTVTSIHPATAFFGKYRRFEGLLSFINYAMVFFLTLQLADRRSRVHALVRTLFASGFIVVAYGVLQYLGVEPIDYGALPFEARRSFATYGNPDLLGGFLMFMLPLAITLALAEDRRDWRIAYWIGALLTSVVMITAFTRSAWVGGSVAIVVLVVMMVLQKVRLRSEDYVMGGSAVGLVGLVAFISTLTPSDVMNIASRVQSIFQFDEGSALTRFQIWGAAWRAVLDRPVLGFGADTFRLVFPYYKPAEYVEIAGYLSVADNVHNYLLQLASALGIPGALLLYGLFVWVLVLGFKKAFAKKAAEQDGQPAFKRTASKDAYGPDIVYSGIWVACIAYIVHLFFGLSVTGTTVIMWILFGLLLAPFAREVEFKRLLFGTRDDAQPSTGAPARYGRAKETLPTASLVVAGAVVLIAVSLSVLNIVYVVADRAYLQARVGAPSHELRIQKAELAVRLNPYNDIYRTEIGLANANAALALLNEGAEDPDHDVPDPKELFAQAEAAFLETIDFVPPEYDNYVFLSNLYNTIGQAYGDASYYGKAIDIAKKGIEVEPFGPAVRLEYARALANTGKTDEAVKELEYAMSLDSAFASGGLLLSQIYVSRGDNQAALELLKSIDARKPDQPGIAEQIQTIEASINAPDSGIGGIDIGGNNAEGMSTE
ncbi:MAG: O-antigen ligase family protein [Coriobacteriia bacterium]|nr:O-antigen ligase family protein [Coriobacteriia bacterium]